MRTNAKNHHAKHNGADRRRAAALILLCVLQLLCTALLPPASVSADSAHVTFTNRKNDETGLYVTKTVQNAGDAVSAPVDDVFTFTLLLDGKLAKEQTYRLYDKNGSRLYVYYNTQTKENEYMTAQDDDRSEVLLKTDKNGQFSLTAGQTAFFPDLPVGALYEVQEEEKQDYRQIAPAGGASAAGTVTSGSNETQFVNLYTKGDGDAGLAVLWVRKDVAYPQGYALPYDDVKFTFTVSVDYEPWAGRAYTVLDDGGAAVETGTTAADGSFAMAGGYTAVFEDVPVGVDYAVTEELPDGWRQLSAVGAEGAVKAPVTVASFANINAAFAVSKQMQDGSKPDEAFAFTLTDADGVPMPDVEYYLYDSDGTLVTVETDPQTQGAQTVRKTDESGQFHLCAGQTAVFVGVPYGTVYNVREEACGGYVQTVPKSTEGYTGQTVGDSVAAFTFENQASERSNSLTVAKRVQNRTGKTVDASGAFTFRLSQKTADDGGFVPMEGQTYSITAGGSTRTYQTGSGDEAGCFTLRANETATFDFLKAEVSKTAVVYRVEEMAVDDVTGEVVYVPLEGYAQEGVLAPDASNQYYSLDMTFTNQYKEKVPVEISKRKHTSDGDLLAGAVLQLLDADKNQVYLPNEQGILEAVEWTSSDEAPYRIEHLEPGTYYVHEVSAPDGYRKRLDDEMLVVGDEPLRNEETGEIVPYTVDFVNTAKLIVPTGFRFRIVLYAALIAAAAAGLILLLYRRHKKRSTT